jgi:ABC-type nitrate/sulfonate/bicarbonate transport system substrate-binding protein
MMKKLEAGEADLAITVTDGFIAGKASGANVALVGTYVDSPLTWAVCAHPDSKLSSISDFFKMDKGKRPTSLTRLIHHAQTL